MIKRIFGITALLAILVSLGVVYRPFLGERPAAAKADLDLAGLLASAEGEAFAAIERPLQFRFPADHGAHPNQRAETWQLSGVLVTDAGRELAVQLTVARLALAGPPGDGTWESGELFAGLLAVTDPASSALVSAQRISRGGIGLAGWQIDPLRLWVENWSIRQAGGGDRALDLDIVAESAAIGLELALRNRQPLIADDEIDLDDGRLAAPFAYYVQPRLRATGKLRVGDGIVAVDGFLSLEHAWGELPLPGGPVARDRFILYFDDGRVLLLARRHRRDRSGRAAAFGLVVDADGIAKGLGEDDVVLEPIDYRPGDDGRSSYPLRWKLRLPGAGIDLELAVDGSTENGPDWAPELSGVLRIESATRATGGTGFAQLDGYRG